MGHRSPPANPRAAAIATATATAVAIAAMAGLGVTSGATAATQGSPAPVPSYSVPFTGAKLARSSAGVVFSGDAFVRIKCPARTFGFCFGSITITASGRQIGRAPLGIRSSDAPDVKVHLTASARSRARGGHLSATATIVSQDGLGRRSTHRQSLTLTHG
jgi:hypothetical protein